MVPANPFEWANPAGAVQFYAIVIVILVVSALKLFGHQWDDWLDERWGRGSVRDTWMLSRMERDARAKQR